MRQDPALTWLLLWGSWRQWKPLLFFSLHPISSHFQHGVVPTLGFAFLPQCLNILVFFLGQVTFKIKANWQDIKLIYHFQYKHPLSQCSYN